jgi:16S rRNA (uracil1498-N3)-methyltransferase
VTVRIYIPKARLLERAVELDPEEVGYLLRVRRLEPGAPVEVFDGEGGTVRATLGAGGDALVLGARTQARLTRRLTFELWQGLAKGDRVELVVQKATELGVARIVPFASSRAVVKLDAVRGASRAARLQKIAGEAARQCGRADVPEVELPASFSDFVAQGAPVVRGLLYERETERSLWPFLCGASDGSRIALAIGPEGGFAPEEVEAAEQAGIAILGLYELGGLILRTETAAIAACTLAALAAGRPASSESMLHPSA